MTSAEMLSRVRTYLDESTAGFWTDAEIYAGLTDGQYDLSKRALSALQQSDVMPFILSGQVVELSQVNVTAGYYALQADELWTVSLLYADVTTEAQVPCRLYYAGREVDVDFDNEFLKGTKAEPLAIQKDVGGNFGWYFTPSSAGFDVTSRYVKKLSVIDGSTEPVLPETSHDSIVQYGYASILRKNTDDFNANPLSAQAYQQYLAISRDVLGRS